MSNHSSVTIHDMYDYHTLLIMRILLKQDSSCIDVGAHQGSILEQIIKLCPHGKHFAFEPIPHLFQSLKIQFPNVSVYDFACSNEEGTSTFFHVENDPAYSGLKVRRYDRPDPIVTEITVAKTCIDNIIPIDQKIEFIKIDVEGGELPVLKGAKQTILRNHPLIIFESGLGASEFYGTTGEFIYEFLVDACGLEINTLDGFLHGKSSLSKERLAVEFNTVSHYYFVAYNKLSEKERLEIFHKYVLDLDMRLFAMEINASGLTMTGETCHIEETNLIVNDWGPKSMKFGEIPNKQPNGNLGIWINVTGEKGIGEARVLFGDYSGHAAISDGLITTCVPPEQLTVKSSIEIFIKQISTGKIIPIGSFRIE